MEFIINSITWLALSWLFFPIAAITILTTYFNVKNERNEFPIFSGIVIGGLVYLASFRFEELAKFSWNNIFYVLGAYVLAGFLVSLFQWIKTLREFKVFATDAKKRLIESFEEDVNGLMSRNAGYTRKEAVDSTTKSHKSSLRSSLSHNFKNVNFDEQTGKFYLGVDKSTMSKHWVYWPFFALSIIFDPITEFVNFVIDYAKNLFTSISKRFAV